MVTCLHDASPLVKQNGQELPKWEPFGRYVEVSVKLLTMALLVGSLAC